MYKVTKEQFANKLNVLIYGDPGSGKTHLAGTAQDVPEMKNVFFFNIDGGLLTLAERGDISANDIHSTKELEQELHRIINCDPEYKGIQTVVIDNISELLTLALEEEANRDFKNRVKRNKNYTVDEVYLEDYGTAGKRLARILRGFRDLPLNVIYIAHKKDKLRKGTNVLEATIPNLTQSRDAKIVNGGLNDFPSLSIGVSLLFLYTIIAMHFVIQFLHDFFLVLKGQSVQSSIDGVHGGILHNVSFLVC